MKFRSILHQIAKDQLDEALDTFEHFFENVSELAKELVLIRGDYSSLKQKEKLNIIDTAEFSLGKNKIRKSILDTFAQVESLVEEEPDSTAPASTKLTNRSEAIREIVQDAVADQGYDIIGEILSDQSSIYFKAKRNSFVQKDYYVIQVLNWYKLSNAQSGYNQDYLDFFSRCPYPFIDLIEFQPGNPSYIIRKYATGIDMNTLIRSGIKLSLLNALEVIVAISKGLLELQKATLFYNRLLPDEIILDNNHDLHILPLNIFEENTNVTTWKHLKDGIKFMSPEQLALAGNKAEQNKLTVISNQFTLGLMLFYALTGESLFDGKGLPSLYEDRINHRDTLAQLKDFYVCVHHKLLRYGLEEATAQELLEEFMAIFDKMIQKKPADRHQDFKDFISQLEFLKLRIEREKQPFDGPHLHHIAGSFSRAIRHNEDTIEDFYQALSTQLASKRSMEDDDGNRNIKFQYAFNYLLTSVTNLENEGYLKASLSGLVKSHHFDFTIEDYEVFFQLLQDSVSVNDPDWNDKVGEAWSHFAEKVLDAIDVILKPIEDVINKD